MGFTLQSLLLFALFIAGCGDQHAAQLPELRLGEDECSRCGMLLSEEEFSCALIVEVNGVRAQRIFDDIGCMLDYEREDAGQQQILDRLVHDYSGKAWIHASDAIFLFTTPESLPTPMASGIAAFAHRADAERVRQSKGGQLLNYKNLQDARQAWREERFGKPN